MDAFGQRPFGDNFLPVDYLDQSAFDEKFEIELEKDYIKNIYHINNKYHVPVLAGGYRDMYNYCRLNLIHPDDRGYDSLMDPDTMEDRFRNSETPGMIKAEFREMLVDGTFRWVQYIGISGVENGVPEGKKYFYVFDIQNQKDRLEGRNSSMYSNDERNPITGLRVRELFVPAIIEMTKKKQGLWCCLAIDIQHFKIFNSWFGYEKGDYLLSRIGKFLLSIEKREDAVAAYFGRDNFAVLLRYDRTKIVEIYKEIRELIHSYSNMLGFLPAIGVYILEEGSKPGFETYDKARVAVEDAKKNYIDRICYFDSSDYEQTRRNYELITEFQKALINDEITFYIQPHCRLTNGRIVGAEALARWVKKDGTLISPGVFVPLLESSGFITELDKRVWDRVAGWLRSLIDRGITPIPVSVNVSQTDLLAMDVAAYFYVLTEHYHIPTKLLKIEITESAYAENFDIISKTITDLQNRGFDVFLDDFGTGYSSLNMLDKINADLIKLDMGFLRKKDSLAKKGIGIVESILGMTKALEIPVIVEGVETEEQMRFLNSLGFRYAQGYYYYKPLQIEVFEEILTGSSEIDYDGYKTVTTDLFHAQEFLNENMFSEGVLNRILGAVAYYTLSDKNLTITRYNDPFRRTIGDPNMEHRIENIQNYVVEADHPMLYKALEAAEQNAAEGGSCEVRFYKSDSSVFWFHMQFYYLKSDGDKKLFYGQVEDITEQRAQSVSFLEVLRKQSDITMCINIDRNEIAYVTGDKTLYHDDLPAINLDVSVQRTSVSRIAKEEDRKAFLEFYNVERLREAYKKAIYHETLNIEFMLGDKPEPVEFSTYYIRRSKADSLYVYAFAKRV